MCQGTALPGNTGGRIQGRARGHRQPRPSRSRHNGHKLGHGGVLGTARGGDGAALGTWGHERRVVAPARVPRNAAGVKLGDGAGGWDSAAGTGTGTRAGTGTGPAAGSRWQPMAGKGSRLPWDGDIPLDHGHHHRATNSGQWGGLWQRCVPVRLVGLGQLPHPPLIPRSSLHPASPCLPGCPGLVSPRVVPTEIPRLEHLHIPQ